MDTVNLVRGWNRLSTIFNGGGWEKRDANMTMNITGMNFFDEGNTDLDEIKWI